MTVVGVAAAGFRGVDVGAVPAFWMPTSMSADANLDETDLMNSPVRWLQILARLRSDVTLAQAQTGLQPWFKAWLQDSTLRPVFPRLSADHRREYLATTLELTSAPQGRHRRPAWPCLPERCRPLFGSGLGARTRDRHSARSRRFARPSRPSTPRR
jgi:hypothetical protein